MSAGCSPSTLAQVSLLWMSRMGERWEELFLFTCLGQPQLCIHVIKHLHCELEPTGEKLISLLDTEEAPLRNNADVTVLSEIAGLQRFG